jgi:purine-nucleoside phosphorylase
VLVVAAWPPELRGLTRLPARLGVRRGVVGVGPVEAAAGCARLIERVRPRMILLVGTAGFYAGAAPRPAIGQACVAGRISFACPAVAAGRAYFPQPMPVAVDGPSRLARRLAGTDAPIFDVACPPGITRSVAVARALAGHSGAALENLEAFAVARAAAAARIPFAAVLGVANQVGPRAHAQWRAHAAAAAAAACARVSRFLSVAG